MMRETELKQGFMTLHIFLTLTAHTLEYRHYAFVKRKGYHSINVKGMYDHIGDL